MEKCILYLRVSTDDQSNSLDVQTERLKEFCKFKNLEIVDILTDEDVSGGMPLYQRSGGAKLKQYINSGIKTIVVLKLDRIFRNVKDALITVDEWTSQDVGLLIADMGGNSVDVKTALGRIFFIQIVSMGEFERKLAGERTKSVLNHKRDKHAVYCREVYGYDNKNGQLVRNNDEYKVIQDIFQMRSSGLNFNQIATSLNDNMIKTRNGKIFHGSTVKKIIENPIHST